MRIVLASRSSSRRAILRGAGIDHEAVAAEVDEGDLKARHVGSPADLARYLADAKALSVTAPGAFVLGGDQVLEFEGEAFDKPKSRQEAAERLVSMSGATHYLRGGLSLARNGEIVWRHASTAAMTMRPMTRADADAYLDAAGEGVLATVGAYEFEGLGARLFDKVAGDFFAVLGLDLLPLAAELRRRGALPW